MIINEKSWCRIVAMDNVIYEVMFTTREEAYSALMRLTKDAYYKQASIYDYANNEVLSLRTIK